jgi:hypothetical protein
MRRGVLLWLLILHGFLLPVVLRVFLALLLILRGCLALCQIHVVRDDVVGKAWLVSFLFC